MIVLLEYFDLYLFQVYFVNGLLFTVLTLGCNNCSCWNCLDTSLLTTVLNIQEPAKVFLSVLGKTMVALVNQENCILNRFLNYG